MAADIYLDYQASTPLVPEVYEVMKPWLSQHFANPHSMHKMGRKASAAVEAARASVSAFFPDGEIIFTSGATEALNLAIIGSLQKCAPHRNKIVTLPSEHAAVLDVLHHIEKYGVIDQAGQHRHFKLYIVPLHNDGLVDWEAYRNSLDGDCALVAAMLVNNEIGVVQPIEKMADAAHEHGALFLCDMVQGFGRTNMPSNVDLAAISGHKIYGPKGIGALWMKKDIALSSIMHGGGQEKGLRSGTLSPALCASLGEAASLMRSHAQVDQDHIEKLINAIKPYIADWTINGSTDIRYQGNLNMRMDGLDVARLMSDLRHIAFSAGSACASGSGRTSHVLEAIGLSESQAKNSIRLGIGRYTQEDEWVAAIKAIDKAAKAQLYGI